MFTGIVGTIGRVEAVDRRPDGLRVRIDAPAIAPELAHGESVSVDGACLTVEQFDDAGFSVFLASETVDRTVLGDRSPGDQVNLERAMPADGRFDGHLVQGHIDTTTTIIDIEEIGEDWNMTFSMPEGYERHIVEKGSIALDGVSLTIAEREPDRFTIAIIPTTLAETTLSDREIGDEVHVEIDVLAKYVAAMLADHGVN